MKRISLKWKLTILYTLLMTLLTGLVLAVLLSLGSGRLLASAQPRCGSGWWRALTCWRAGREI